jgi:transposase-like protein
MSRTTRRRFDSKFKTKVVIESLKEQKTLAALSKEYGLHPQQITDWRKQAISGLPQVFDPSTNEKHHKSEEAIDLKNSFFTFTIISVSINL